MKTFNLIAPVASGIESVTNKELKDLGYQTQSENGYIRFQGNEYDIALTNISLRSADRIKIVVAEFKTYNFDDLFDNIRDIPWQDYLDYRQNFVVNARTKNSSNNSVPNIQRISEKAIIETLRPKGFTGFLPKEGPIINLEVAIDKDVAMITIDTTGDSLFKRGYRVNKGGAPLKENFAAALVLLTNWFPDNPFVDPTTGSGTIPIEAALIGRNIAPGLLRHFTFENFYWFDKKQLELAKDAADAKADYDTLLEISGFDIDGRMVEIAKQNAKQAGVSQDIKFQQLAVKDWSTTEENGIIVSNPPYGQRLGELEEAEVLYKQMGQIYNQLPTWSKYILTSDENFENVFGARATKKRKLYNGALRVDYYQYWGKKNR
ncbi:MAG: class I SAM-dependent RNA methyltransferase [Lactobacillaceae bacterium]|jgi:putative N6-adenine-specific DNA methylase|nr:class I SAM-dependent RNA methyltransferase [Lactobacillaceae bacterium]